ncbi:SIMPL domain-containing protein [Geobacter sp. SVR]|uniref:SIMPL domain-containing protein n=1 Tax=Geobacter sp. SVR TaxID=2495594 RepID=UPI001564FE38|nr:SIMPL domain-containing protein [Geobacter sp. SVR]
MIKVSGTGIVTVKPDMATIYVQVSRVDRNIVSAKKAVDENVAKIQEMLLDSGVKPDDINTSSLGVYEERGGQFHREGGNVASPEGYRVSRDIVSEIHDLARLDVILDNALKLGANSIQGIRFLSGDIEKLKATALEKASDDAHRKAEFLAKKFGCGLGPARQIEYDYKGQAQPFPVAAGALRSSEASFLLGTIEITATVNVVYQMQ